MATRSHCGKCDQEFEPKPYIYGGGNLCDSCREKASDKIQKAKDAYDKLDATTRSDVDFASSVSDALPQPRTVNRCLGCGTTVGDDGGLCSSCASKQEREAKEYDKEQARARKDFDRKIKGL